MKSEVAPKVQINTSYRVNNQNELMERTILLNIREENVFKAVQLYNLLNKKITDSDSSLLPQQVSDNEEIKVDNAPFPTEDEETPDCPYCGDVMVKRRSKDGNQFWGCPNYRSKGCRGSRPIY